MSARTVPEFPDEEGPPSLADLFWNEWDEDIPNSCRAGKHLRERKVFNGGSPWIICWHCGTKLRDAD